MADLNESQQPQLRRETIAVTVLAAVFVILRFISRFKKGLNFGIDDYTIVLALVFLFADAGFNLALVHFGMGLHAEILPPENLVIIGKVLMSYECVYCTTVGIIKISILLMYSRIFPTREFRIAAYILGSIVVSWVIAIIFVSVFQCTPIEKTWNPTIPGTCINLKGSFIGNAIPNILTDIAILSLPVRVVWRLHASVTHRLSVMFVFLLGSFVVFTSIYRFTTLFLFQPEDLSWTLSTACTWCVIECASGIISACLPTLRPLFVLISRRFGSSNASRMTPGAHSNDAHASLGGKNHESGFPPFRRLSDSAFRPADKARGMRMDVAKRDDESGSGDEVPLNTIRVQRDIKWEATMRVEEH